MNGVLSRARSRVASLPAQAQPQPSVVRNDLRPIEQGVAVSGLGTTAVAVGTDPVEVVKVNPARELLIIENIGTVTLYYAFNKTTPVPGRCHQLAVGQILFMDAKVVGTAINFVCDTQGIVFGPPDTVQQPAPANIGLLAVTEG